MVKYRVVRDVQFPYWWGWYSWRYPSFQHSGAQEITHGETKTDANGKFTIEFSARPDLGVPKESRARFFNIASMRM